MYDINPVTARGI